MTNHDDLHRDIGRMEGRLGAMEDSLSEIKDVLREVNSRLAKIEAQENERKGIWKTIVSVSGIVSALTAAAYKYLTS